MADITIDQISTQTFYQIPQIFFPSIEKEYSADGKVKKKIKLTSPYDRKLSNDAKLAYGILYNRCLLSIRSYQQGVTDYVDENGSVFMVYTVYDLMEVLDKGKMTVHKIKKELQEVGLLREVSQGANRPNRLYLQNVDANLQEYEHYEATHVSTGRGKGKIVYTHIRTLNLQGDILFEQSIAPEEENGSPKNGRPTNPVKSTKNGSPKNGRPISDTQGVHNMDGIKIDISNTEYLDISSRKQDPSPKPTKYISKGNYALLENISDHYRGATFYHLTHEQKMKIGGYLERGYIFSDDIVLMIDYIDDSVEKPLAYLLTRLSNLEEERRLEAKARAHQQAAEHYR